MPRGMHESIITGFGCILLLSTRIERALISSFMIYAYIIEYCYRKQLHRKHGNNGTQLSFISVCGQNGTINLICGHKGTVDITGRTSRSKVSACGQNGTIEILCGHDGTMDKMERTSRSNLSACGHNGTIKNLCGHNGTADTTGRNS